MIDRVHCFLTGHRWSLLSTSADRSGMHVQSWGCARCPAVDVVRRRSGVPLSPEPGGIFVVDMADRLIYATLVAIAAAMIVVGVTRGYFR